VAAKRLGPALLIIGLLSGAVAAAAAEPPIIIVPPQIKFRFNAHITPANLPKSRRTGVSLRIDSKLSTEDGSHPPALKELSLELDKHMAVNARGLPTCRRRPLEADDTVGAEMDCKTAIVGEGRAEIEIAQPEQAPFPVVSKVLAFNVGVFDGKTKLLLFAYLATPVSAPLLIPVEVSREQKGIFGLRGVAMVPKIAGSYGSVTRFSLKLGREFTYRGQPQSYLLASCPSRQFVAKVTEVLSDGSRLSGTAVRACTPQA
jgi:hypothetical protein